MAPIGPPPNLLDLAGLLVSAISAIAAMVAVVLFWLSRPKRGTESLQAAIAQPVLVLVYTAHAPDLGSSVNGKREKI